MMASTRAKASHISANGARKENYSGVSTVSTGGSFPALVGTRFSRTSRGSCRKQNASAEQVEAGVTIHLALDQLQPVDLPFGLAVAPGRGESGAYRIAVLLQPGSERLHRRDATPAGLDEPGIQFGTGCTGSVKKLGQMTCLPCVDRSG